MVLGCAGVAVAGMASAQAAVGAPARHAAPAHRRGPVAGSAAATAAAGAAAGDYARACPVTRKQVACMALTRTNVRQRPQRLLGAGVPPSTDGYSPAGLQGAYALPSSYGIFPSNDGTGETVAVVDAYNDPDAASDLATYRADWRLPPCGTGCFQQVNQNGQTSPLPGTEPPNEDWATEESLDLDMVSAICPNCHILLVEANGADIADLGTAVNTAVKMGAKFVSNSYGQSESSSDPGYDAAYFNHPGVVITASAGDDGYGVSYPAASRYVTSVGGTSLSLSNASRGWTETAWGGTGSGCSADDAKPPWQTDSGCGMRTDNDVAADADPNTGVAVYDTYDQSGWLEVGGTSASAPIIAAVYALAGPPAAGTYPSSYIYRHTSSLYDITSGWNTFLCFSYLCGAGPGYDGPTGWGTPDGLTAFTAPAQELLQSGSFENSAAGWTKFIPTGATVNMSLYNTTKGAPATAQDGHGYLAFNTNTGGGGVYQDVPVHAFAGTSYTGTAWLSAQDGTATGSLCLWGLGATNTSNCRSYSVTPGSYTKIQVVYNAPVNVSTVRFQLYPTANGGTTDMDTASLEQNLLQSGSFENSAAGWTRFVPAGATVNMALYNTTTGAPAAAQDGHGYLAFNTNTGGGGVYQDVPVAGTAGTSYTGTAWLSAQSGTATGTLCLWGLGATGTSNCRPYSVTAGSYTEVQVAYDAPSNVSTVRFQLYPTANGGTTDMDTASLEPNLLQSGSFESSDTGWNVMPVGDVDMLLRNTAQGAPGPAQDGDGYLQVNAIATGGSAYQDIPVAASAGTSYTGTAWLSAQSGTATGTLCLWGLGATSTNNCRSYSVTAGSYAQIQVVYDAPENISTLRFQLYPTPGGGTTYLDTASVG
jgi:hypothetical protein